MGSLTADPFETYADEYGVSATDIRAATEEPRVHATELSMLVHELQGDSRRAGGHVTGDITTDVVRGTAASGGASGSLAASGLFAAGVLDYFADRVAEFDKDVGHLNADYHQRMKYEAGVRLDSTLEPALVAPVLGAADPQRVRQAVLGDLRPRYRRARQLLDEQVDLVVQMLRKGPEDRFVRLLATTGAIPVGMLGHFPGVVLSPTERQQAMRHVEVPQDFWGLVDPASSQDWCAATEDPDLRHTVFPLAGPTDLADAPTGYYGGGFATGPDGRRYPLVVPVLGTDQGSVLAIDDGDRSVDDLGGADQGWHTLLSQNGVDLFGDRTDSPEKAIIGHGVVTGSTTGAVPSSQGRLDALDQVCVGPGGRPMLAGASRAPATHLDDDTWHAYHVVYQENDDGRRRALLNTYDVVRSDTDDCDVAWSRSYVDEAGRLVQVPVRRS